MSKMIAKIKIISLNVKGLHTLGEKRRKIFHWLTNHVQADIACLQESHSCSKDEHIWQKEWGGDIIFSHGTTNCKGTCILIKSSVDFVLHSSTPDSNGRYIILDLSINDTRITLVSLYGPNQDVPDFFSTIFEITEKVGNDNRIIVGDFNCILNNEDKKGGQQVHINKKSSIFLKEYIQEFELVDIWRSQHKSVKGYTFHTKYKGQNIFSRLDYFLISIGLSIRPNKAEISPSILTDHSMISLLINLDNSERGPGFWKLNCSLLHDIDYVTQIKNTITETVKLNSHCDSKLLWDTIKLQIRRTSIRYASFKKRNKINLTQATKISIL
jgi:exonuclease III